MTIIPPKKEHIIFDSQLLTTLMACPRKFNNTFNLNLVRTSGPSNSLECGLMVHFMLDVFSKAIIAGKNRNDAIDDSFAAGKEFVVPFGNLNKFVLDSTYKGLLNTPKESVRAGTRSFVGSDWVFETMRQYYDYWQNSTWTIVSSEEVRGDVIYEDDEMRVIWKAKLDRIVDIESGFTPVDTKTSKQRGDTLFLNNQFMGQCWLLKSRNMIVDKIGFQTSLKPHEKFERVMSSYSTDRIGEWVYEVVPHYARMLVFYRESGYFPPQFTSCKTKYGTCEYLDSCEADRGIRDETLKLNFVEGKKWDISNDDEGGVE